MIWHLSQRWVKQLFPVRRCTEMHRSTITAVGAVPQSTAHFTAVFTKYSTILRCAVRKLMPQNLCGTGVLRHVRKLVLHYTVCIVAVPGYHFRTLNFGWWVYPVQHVILIALVTSNISFEEKYDIFKFLDNALQYIIHLACNKVHVCTSGLYIGVLINQWFRNLPTHSLA